MTPLNESTKSPMEASWERKHTDNELTNISSRSASATELYLMRPPPEKYLCTVRLDYYFQIDVTLQAKKRARGYTEAPETILITAETRQSQMRPTSETTVCIPLGDTASCAHQCVTGLNWRNKLAGSQTRVWSSICTFLELRLCTTQTPASETKTSFVDLFRALYSN
jgi:hypothetical protein